MATKAELLRSGIDLAQAFCQANGLPMPTVQEAPADRWPFDVCAYYRADKITICPARCAGVGLAGRAWSYPGYVVDRTPYGVIQHELGHHVDLMRGTAKGAYWSDYGAAVKTAAREEAITSYCPNDAEWFAEMFRLFVTNPDLLRKIRPRTHARLLADGFVPVFQDTWEQRLAGAPDRTLRAAGNKIPQGDLFNG